MVCKVRFIKEPNKSDIRPTGLILQDMYYFDTDETRRIEDSKYIKLYYDQEKKHPVGYCNFNCFRIIRYKYYKYEDISIYINKDIEIQLKDIVDWCLYYSGVLDRADKIIKYIDDNKLNTREYDEKYFLIKHRTFIEYYKENKLDLYKKYGGYSLEMCGGDL